MIFGLFGGRRRNANRRIVTTVYETLTAAARAPAFYTAMSVPDSVMGRFEMLAVEMVLFLRRTRGGSVEVEAIAQEVVDEFFLDLDHSIREIGIGDVGVPKRMKKFARMFYGRAEAYSAALDARDTWALADALKRNVHPENENAPDMLALAHYMTATEDALAGTPDAAILSGELTVPRPKDDEE
ncbi:ubiquinol-cytochrome C chaperone family protein [Pararhizobium mangrovi]|uniref:Ubiquinol-cytochrome C chaperone n=1 Tax=Pararhizobium mangrovi TaxID=2590452 RepID=A0A506UG18_9HYPH|nr:ubiquinol-cytochrome C chaperone family protein [Pararhizobium mangrovi]TPW31899.1 ubiquinol-cytochrome C chaperone [Pararhizobium mangrovi]